MNPKASRYTLQMKICTELGWTNSGFEKRIKYLWTLSDEQLQSLWDSLQMGEAAA